MNYFTNDVLFFSGLLFCCIILIYNLFLKYYNNEHMTNDINETESKLTIKINNISNSLKSLENKMNETDLTENYEEKQNLHDSLIKSIQKQSVLSYDPKESIQKVNWKYTDKDKEKSKNSDNDIKFVGLTFTNNTKVKELIDVIPQTMINYRHFQEHDKLTNPTSQLPPNGSIPKKSVNTEK